MLRLVMPAAVSAVFVAFATTAAAQPGAAEVEAACAAELNLPAGACACMGERAAQTLNDDQRSLVVASYISDDAETARLRTTMNPMDLLDTVTFMRTAPVDCVSGG